MGSRVFHRVFAGPIGFIGGGGSGTGESLKGAVGGVTSANAPPVPEVPEVTTEIDTGAVRDARTAEAERLRKKRGRASTITKKKPGLLGAETTGGLLGG
jgi:hypothetical protein